MARLRITPVNIQLGRNRVVRRAYGIDEIALVPGGRTVDPAVTDSSWTLAGVTREIPIIASAMDGVVDVGVAVELTKLGALGVLNLEGVQCRYDDPNPVLDRIAAVGKEEFVPLMQELYSQPVREDLIRLRIAEIKEKGGIAAVSATPVAALRFGQAIAEAGADLFFVQATVVSTEHIGPEGQETLDLAALRRDFGVPVVIGNCVTYEVALQLMRAGAAGVMVGIGPGAACTSRGVLGIGIPQATSVADCAAARDDHEKESGRRVPVIAGTGANSTSEALFLTQKAMEAGADACLLVTPYYNKPTQEGLYRHYKQIADRVAIPQILYNVPGRTACDMKPETVERLADIPNIVGIKEASGSIERIQELVQRLGERMDVYSGDDALAAAAMLNGARGVISVTANVAPQLMHEMCVAALAGDRVQAEALDARLAGLHRALFLESNPIPVKWAVAQLGLIPAGIRLPLTPLSEALYPDVRAAMRQAGVL